MTMSCLEFDGDSHESSAHWFGMTVLFGTRTSLYKFTICVPQNDTERVRLGTKTDHVRHDLAVGPADKFQFAAVRKEGGKKAGLRCKKGAIPPSKRGNTPEPSADGSGVVHKPRGTLLTPFTCHTQSGRSLTREIFSWFWYDREADRMRATKRYRAGGAARSESKS